MPGGLLNLISYGNQNVFLNGNPTKTFFKFVYMKYTNFGLQKFRIDYEGQKTLRLSESSEFTFKVPRYAELLMDTYLVMTLPDIYSPIYPPQSLESTWKPYEFKWIEHLGAEMIEEVKISVGGFTIQKYSGNYIKHIYQRDMDDKRELFDEMIGNTPRLNDPANYGSRKNKYPSTYYKEDNVPEPSIRGRQLYVPLSTFFSFDSKMAFPLTCLQYSEMYITIRIRPVKEMFTINDVTDSTNGKYTRIQPNFNLTQHSFYKFLQPPPSIALSSNDYGLQTTSWNSDIHILGTYCFLTEDEGNVFAKNEQKYLIKEVREHTFHDVVNSKKIKMETNGMVANWMWFLRRNDAYLRNEWGNYTNYEYKDIVPSGLIFPYVYGEVSTSNVDFEKATVDIITKISSNTLTLQDILDIGPSKNPNNSYTGIYLTGEESDANVEDILEKVSILFDGKYRENELDAKVYEYLEKFRTSSSKIEKGLYCYSFGMKTDLREIQPSGAINLNKFRNVEIEIKTITPELDTDAETLNICTDDGTLIGVNKNAWDIYKYTYDFIIQEERYNIAHFTSGHMSLMYA